MDYLKKTKELITEAYKFVQDALLFFKDGNKYFEKIKDEDYITNTYRLFVYICFYVIISTYFLSETPKFDQSLITNVRTVIFQLPLLSFAYLIAMFLFSDCSNKIKLCLNYVIFQQSITGSVPILLLAAFMHSESYVLYLVYAASTIAVICFIVYKFALLFFDRKRNKVFGGVTVIASVMLFAFLVSYFDIHVPEQKGLALEDPIASEFFNLECLSETESIFDLVKSAHKKNEEVSELVTSLTSYISSEPSIPSEANFFLSTKKAQQTLYKWKLEKEREIDKIKRNISLLESKHSKARFSNNKIILSKNIETYKQYKEFLEEYDKTITVLASFDYDNLSAVKRKSFEDSSNDVKKSMQIVTDIIMKWYQIDIMQLNLGMAKKLMTVTTNHIEVANKAFDYVKFILKIKNYFPLYHCQMPS